MKKKLIFVTVVGLGLVTVSVAVGSKNVFHNVNLADEQSYQLDLGARLKENPIASTMQIKLTYESEITFNVSGLTLNDGVFTLAAGGYIENPFMDEAANKNAIDGMRSVTGDFSGDIEYSYRDRTYKVRDQIGETGTYLFKAVNPSFVKLYADKAITFTTLKISYACSPDSNPLTFKGVGSYTSSGDGVLTSTTSANSLSFAHTLETGWVSWNMHIPAVDDRWDSGFVFGLTKGEASPSFWYNEGDSYYLAGLNKNSGAYIARVFDKAWKGTYGATTYASGDGEFDISCQLFFNKATNYMAFYVNGQQMCGTLQSECNGNQLGLYASKPNYSFSNIVVNYREHITESLYESTKLRRNGESFTHPTGSGGVTWLLNKNLEAGTITYDLQSSSEQVVSGRNASAGLIFAAKGISNKFWEESGINYYHAVVQTNGWSGIAMVDSGWKKWAVAQTSTGPAPMTAPVKVAVTYDINAQKATISTGGTVRTTLNGFEITGTQIGFRIEDGFKDVTISNIRINGQITNGNWENKEGKYRSSTQNSTMMFGRKLTNTSTIMATLNRSKETTAWVGGFVFASGSNCNGVASTAANCRFGMYGYTQNAKPDTKLGFTATVIEEGASAYSTMWGKGTAFVGFAHQGEDVDFKFVCDLANHQILPSYSLDGRTTWTSLSTIFLQSTNGLVMDDIGYFGLGAGYDSGSFTAIYKNISIDGESF